MMLSALLKFTAFALVKSSTLTICVQDSPLRITEDLPLQEEAQKIPKIFHTIWLNFGKGDEVFPKYVENMQKLQNLHPEWQFKLWRESEILNLIKEKYPDFLETFENYDVPIKKHDASRALILFAHGGVYLDQDFIPLKNIDPLMKSYEFVIGNEEKFNFTPVNGLIGSIKGHPFLRMFIDEMKKPEIAGKPVLEATGPVLIRDVMLEYSKKFGSKGIKIYNHKFFYPVSYDDKEKLKRICESNPSVELPYCYLLQEYDANWK